ncbi:hypothetical protein ACFPK5_01670 [Streptomyces beijiangensis]
MQDVGGIVLIDVDTTGAQREALYVEHAGGAGAPATAERHLVA